MLRQLGTKVNNAMEFYIKELLLIGTLTRCERTSLIDQILLIGTDMDVKHAKARVNQGVFARCG